MTRTSTRTPVRPYLIALLLLLSDTFRLSAQCTDWSISAQLVTSSTCAGNGTFNVTISGPDAANLSNIQYGIPIAANGFSVPLNNSASFSSIPPGIYQVSAVASCGGTFVGRNTSISVPGNYQPPILQAALAKASLNCNASGTVLLETSHGLPPYTVWVTNTPASYSGPSSFNVPLTFLQTGLPPGGYTFQVTDACGSGTAPVSVNVGIVSAQNIPLAYTPLETGDCQSVIAWKPTLNFTIPGWIDYTDTGYKVSIRISNSIAPATPFVPLHSQSAVTVPLGSGHSVKDCYGQQLIYTIKPPCGPNFEHNKYIPFPSVSSKLTQNCNSSFSGFLKLQGPLCLPVTFTVQQVSGPLSYGPFSSSNGTLQLPPAVPLGNYLVQYTTADGYTSSYPVSVAPITGNPYSVSIMDGSPGMTNYIAGFRFQTTAGLLPIRTVELFNGPLGYTFIGYWGGGDYHVTANQTPLTFGSRFFPPGNYVWKITDSCGSYLLPITVGPQDVYQFTTGMDFQKQTCQGLWVRPAITATNNGQSKPAKFSILKNGYPLYIPANSMNWPQYAAGDSVLLTQPGTYTILPSAANSTFYIPQYPNPYTNIFSFANTLNPVMVDMNKSQGFLCAGASPGQAHIYVEGKNGFPFLSPPSPHYLYSLAHQGNGTAGPYLATNASGVFTGFGGSANQAYDLKIQDSCGAFAVQKLKILDLQTVRAISSSKYVACEFGTVQLSAIYLPNATYSWTGPNGFTSNLREPVISNVGPQQIGVYHVTVITPLCGQPVTDSTVLSVNPPPPQPTIAVRCSPEPVSVYVVNPQPGIGYLHWEISNWLLPDSVYYSYRRISDSAGLKVIDIEGSYRAIAVDSLTGCTIKSDSISFPSMPGPFEARIYAPHLKLCPGDTTVLVAQSLFTGALSYQWFKNSVLMPGITVPAFATSDPGVYKVVIRTGPCNADTSDEVTVSVVPFPTATINAPVTTICEGDTAFFEAGTGSGYTYTWALNGYIVPGMTNSILPATQPGSYMLTVSNGGCAASAGPVSLTVNPSPIPVIQPAGTQYLCPGGTIQLTTAANPGLVYSWAKDGALIPGANTSQYNASAPGSYTVTTNALACPARTSLPVVIVQLPAAVSLGNDTVVCAPGPFAIPLSVPVGYSSVIWSNGQNSNQITATATGTWWVRAENKCGVFTDTIHIRHISEFMPALPDDTLICNPSGKALVSVSVLLQNIQWSTGATTSSLEITMPGIYWVQGESPCGTLYDTVRVSFCPPVISNILMDDSLCEGDCMTVSAEVSDYPRQYQWLLPGGNPQASTDGVVPRVCYAVAGSYTVTLIVANNGGTDTMSRPLVVLPRPVPRFADTALTISYNTLMALGACADAQEIDWYRNDSLVCDNCKEMKVDARYFLSDYRCVVSNGSCTDTCSYRVRVVDIPHDVWLPDAFSPNGDGRNDEFRVITDNPNILVINLCVYNRWGQRMFISNMNNRGWDGAFSGSAVPVGTYFWTLRYKVLGSEEVYFKKGDLVLIR